MGVKRIKNSNRIFQRLSLLPSGHPIINLKVHKSVKLLTSYMADFLEKCVNNRKLEKSKNITQTKQLKKNYVFSSLMFMSKVLPFLYYTQKFIYLTYCGGREEVEV